MRRYAQRGFGPKDGGNNHQASQRSSGSSAARHLHFGQEERANTTTRSSTMRDGARETSQEDGQSASEWALPVGLTREWPQSPLSACLRPGLASLFYTRRNLPTPTPLKRQLPLKMEPSPKGGSGFKSGVHKFGPSPRTSGRVLCTLRGLGEPVRVWKSAPAK